METNPAAQATTAPRTHSCTSQDGALLSTGQSSEPLPESLAWFGLRRSPRCGATQPSRRCRLQTTSPQSSAIFINRLPSTRCGLHGCVNLMDEFHLRTHNLRADAIFMYRLRCVGPGEQPRSSRRLTVRPSLCCLCLMAIFMNRLLM